MRKYINPLLKILLIHAREARLLWNLSFQKYAVGMGLMQRAAGILMILFSFIGGALTAGDVTKVHTVKSDDGWELFVNGKPFFVKGMCYNPAKVGEDPGTGTLRDWMIVDDNNDGIIDSPYQSWVDKNKNNKRDEDEPIVGDFQLLKDLGCNTIRVYHHASGRDEIQSLYADQVGAKTLYSHKPNKEVLRDLFESYGIYVAMGDLLGAYVVGSGADWEMGTDYTNPVHRKNMLMSVEEMVRNFKDEPYILFWILGNENNYAHLTKTNAASEPEAYATFVNEAARLIKKLDPNHPVALSNGDIQLLYAYAKYTPDIDILGLNAYRGPGFGDLWKKVASTYDKPIVFTEFGSANALKIRNGILDEDEQARIHQAAFCDMWRHRAGGTPPGNSIGGFVFEWLDQWWHDKEPWTHNLGLKGWHGEWNGVASQGNGRHSPFLRQLRKVYFTYQSLWTGEAQCPE